MESWANKCLAVIVLVILRHHYLTQSTIVDLGTIDIENRGTSCITKTFPSYNHMVDHIGDLYKHEAKHDGIYCDESALGSYDGVVFITSSDGMEEDMLSRSGKVRHDQGADDDVDEGNFFLGPREKEEDPPQWLRDCCTPMELDTIEPGWSESTMALVEQGKADLVGTMIS